MGKRLLSLLLCLVLVLGLCSVAYADGSAISATATATTLESDGTTTITVHLKATELVKSIGLDVSFDSDYLELTSATAIVEGANPNTYNTSKNKLAAMLGTAAAYDGNILTFTLKAKTLSPGTNITKSVTLTPVLKNGSTQINASAISVDLTLVGPEIVHTHTLIPTAAKDATCTEPGNIAYWTCTGDDGCGKIFSDAEGTTEIALADTVIPAKEHAYGAPTYEWATDHSTCTGTVVCANDASHTITETVTASVETVAATCEAQGGETYTATFTKSEFTTQTYVKDPADPALGHDLVKTEAVAPTCTEDGNIAYWTCKREGCGKIFSDEAGTVVITMADTVDPAKGHDYSEVTFTWADDYSKVTATSICKNDASHVLNETATATAQTTDASCTEDGKTVYTAEFPRDTGLGIQTKEVSITKLGHNMTPTAAKPATCTEAGNNAYYTCDRCNKVFKDAEGATETTVEAETLPALGHKVGETAPTVTWTGDTATVTFTCANCNNSVTEDAEVTAEDNILTASYNGVAYDKKHKDSTTNVGSVDATAKDENGNDVPIQEDAKGADAIPDANLLTPQEAANKSEYTKDELQVVWQSEISATGSTGPVTLTFKVTGITAAQKILVFHFTGGAWKLEAEGALGASEVQVKFSSLSPVALVVQSAAPPATGDSNNTFIWAGAMVMAAIAASYVVMTSRKGKHEA